MQSAGITPDQRVVDTIRSTRVPHMDSLLAYNKPLEYLMLDPTQEKVHSLTMFLFYLTILLSNY